MNGLRFARLRLGDGWRGYERQLKRTPLAVQATTSAILWGVGDVLAQRLAEKRSLGDIDKRRAFLTMAFGASFMGPVGHFWYMGLDIMAKRLFSANAKRLIAAKVIVDSVVLGPLYVLAFYAFGSHAIDQTGWSGFKEKMDKDFWSTYLAELMIWPAFQTFNFIKVPLAHQLLAVNLMTLVDASFLSWARSQDDWVGIVRDALKPKPKALKAAKADGKGSGGSKASGK